MSGFVAAAGDAAASRTGPLTIGAVVSAARVATSIQARYRSWKAQREARGLILCKKSWSATRRSTALGTGIFQDERHAHEMRVLAREGTAESKEGAKVALRANVLAKLQNLTKGFSQCGHPMLLSQAQWIEATDRKHRYGGHLKFYGNEWYVRR